MINKAMRVILPFAIYCDTLVYDRYMNVWQNHWTPTHQFTICICTWFSLNLPVIYSGFQFQMELLCARGMLHHSQAYLNSLELGYG